MICPKCSADTLQVLGHIELGRIGAAYENTVQRAQCANCKDVFFCIYTEERPISMTRDNRVSHCAYRAARMAWHSLGFAFEAPKPATSARWRRQIGAALHAQCNSDRLIGPIVLE